MKKIIVGIITLLTVVLSGCDKNNIEPEYNTYVDTVLTNPHICYYYDTVTNDMVKYFDNEYVLYKDRSRTDYSEIYAIYYDMFTYNEEYDGYEITIGKNDTIDYDICNFENVITGNWNSIIIKKYK